MRKAQIALIRHSVTQWNEENRIQGHFDSPLTKYGIKLAQSWIPTLKPETFDAVITSDLPRTIETAKVITDGIDIPFFKMPGLREQDWGTWSGMTYEEVEQLFPGEMDIQINRGWDFRPYGGESRRETSHRARNALCEGMDKIIETLGNDFPKVLAVIHEGVLKTITYSLAGHDFLPTSRKLVKRRRLHWLTWNGTLSIDRLNDTL